ncbi:ABC transporter ATP-binding protein [Desulfohalobiaceae bacterium Ax17]|uniref:metal ABC transporter ATP-binding protein n=1 Tax=Desulfovulcanus ferrireducens TaxID=2831190 RepID=UPI00207BA2EC|nr:ABC transporter ATP-binding protein [Desulfovulcanus ferrireducens]MBT8764491.1 ABC transporter ATP-binding protein [Desulfovulcanus ferrireducens]
MNSPVIELRNVSLAYGDHLILEDVDLRVEHGEFVAILGPNGGGKTTLLKIILGLLKPDKGQVLVFGQEPHKSYKRIGYVPQHRPDRDLFPITVLGVVLMGLGSRRLGFTFGRKEKKQAYLALEKVGMHKLAHSRINELSGGQKQRVLVARALVSEPELLIFDEPTASIDPQGKQCIYEFLANLGEEVTVLVVTHDLIVASSQISRIAVVNKRIIMGQDRNLTREMLDLLYGIHDYPCPMGNFIDGVSTLFEETEARKTAEQSKRDLN